MGDGPDGKLPRYWDRQASRYDRSMDFWDRRLFGSSRPWACSRAAGDVLEVAIGTGRNLSYYPEGTRLTGMDWSPRMLAIARERAARLGRQADLRPGDAQALDFPDGSFDTVVCTLGLCAIPDERRAVSEMARVLRPGGRLLLVDHVAARPAALRAVQGLYELISVPLAGEHFRRRPLRHVRELGLGIEEAERFRLGVVERVAARKPVSLCLFPTRPAAGSTVAPQSNPAWSAAAPPPRRGLMCTSFLRCGQRLGLPAPVTLSLAAGPATSVATAAEAALKRR